MSAQGIAARMVARNGSEMEAWFRIAPRLRYYAERYRCFGMARDASRLTLWRAVSTALGRMEASV